MKTSQLVLCVEITIVCFEYRLKHTTLYTVGTELGIFCYLNLVAYTVTTGLEGVKPKRLEATSYLNLCDGFL